MADGGADGEAAEAHVGEDPEAADEAEAEAEVDEGDARFGDEAGERVACAVEAADADLLDHQQRNARDEDLGVLVGELGGAPAEAHEGDERLIEKGYGKGDDDGEADAHEKGLMGCSVCGDLVALAVEAGNEGGGADVEGGEERGEEPEDVGHEAHRGFGFVVEQVSRGKEEVGVADAEVEDFFEEDGEGENEERAQDSGVGKEGGTLGF